MPTFETHDAFMASISGNVKEAVQKAGEELLKLFIENYVDEYAYGGAITGDWYKPTGQFRASWRKKMNRGGYMWETEIYYNPNGVMWEESERWQHYSNFGSWGGAASYMDKLLNVQGVVGIMGIRSDGSTWSWNYRNQAYWDKFQDEVIDTGLAERFVEQALAEQEDFYY